MSTPWIVAFGVLWGLVILIAIVLVGVVRRAVAVLEATDLELTAQGWRPTFGGAPSGTTIPEFFVSDRAGEQVAWTELLGEPRVWVFLESDCPPCRQLVAELERTPEAVDDVPLAVFMNDNDAARSMPFPSAHSCCINPIASLPSRSKATRLHTDSRSTPKDV